MRPKQQIVVNIKNLKLLKSGQMTTILGLLKCQKFEHI